MVSDFSKQASELRESRTNTTDQWNVSTVLSFLVCGRSSVFNQRFSSTSNTQNLTKEDISLQSDTCVASSSTDSSDTSKY